MERSEKRFGIRDQPDGLKATSIAQLDHGGGVDVDADDADPSRQQISHGNGMQGGGDHQAEVDIAQQDAHLPLSFDDIGHNVR